MGKTDIYSKKQPIWQLVLLLFCTFGFYNIFWFYRNWKQLYPPNNIKVRPWLRTIGLIIPFVAPFLIWFQFIDIKKFADKQQVKPFRYPGWLTLAYFVSIGACNKLLDSFAFLVLPVATLLLIIPQMTINRYWEKETPNLLEKTRLLWLEICICCLGGILYLLVLADLLLKYMV